MTEYATALEIWGPSHDTTNFGSGNSRERTSGLRTKHAVAHPGSELFDRNAMKTVCGKSMQEYRIRLVSGADRVPWPPTEDEKDICSVCRKAVGQQS